MNYNDFKKLCDSSKVQVSDITCRIGMTYQGLKAGLNSGKLGSDKVLAICKELQISPNAFFGWEPINRDAIAAASAIEALQQQLAVKDHQIAELHALLSKK